MKLQKTSLVLTLVAIVSTSTQAADLTGYIVTDTANSVVFRVNFDTAANSPIGPSGKSSIRSLAVRPSDQALFASNPQLLQIDTTTGVATKIADWSADDLSFYNGLLYGISNGNRLTRYNLSNGETAELPVFALFPTVRAFTVDANGNGIGWDDGSKFLFRVNIETGATTNLGLLPGDFHSFKYGPDGNLYAWGGGGLAGNLHRINVDSVTSTQIQSVFVVGQGFAFNVVPEPCVGLSVGVACVFLLLRRCKRGRADGSLY
jgi:hypothetical protein